MTNTAADQSRDQPNDQPNSVLYLADAAQTIREEALASARAKMAVPDRDLPLAQLLERADFLDYVTYGLATGIAAVLASHDSGIQAIYMYDPAGNPGGSSGNVGGNPGSDGVRASLAVHQLIRVGRPSAALEILITALDHALLAALRDLPVCAGRAFILDASLISDADAAQERGYAALLNSMFAPPLKVWERET
ncbi:MAG: hypothetical protein JXQ72_05360 [Anaerolineae bacterium]|nr:hypothetical protein [Anaerolineae bacterium]